MNKICYLSFLVLLMSLLSMACGQPKQPEGEEPVPGRMHRQLPRVLIITTGLQGQNAILPKGIVIALQAFNKQGAVVRLEPRDILNEPGRLKTYNMIILSTAPGYHDADRKYSLSFMSESEMENLTGFVEEGGVLISGDNIGRNQIDGTDRIQIHNILSPQVYPLARCFGLELAERNMEGYEIYGNIGGGEDEYIRPEAGKNFYTPVPDTIFSEKAEIMARWINEADTLPAIVKNRYGKGTAYLLASSDFLHPANAGGFMSTQKITRFYESVVEDFQQRNNIPLSLNPWPSACDYAFCLTLNAGGNMEQYKRTLNLLNEHDMQPTIFVDGNVDQEIMEFLQNEDIRIESRGYAFTNYRNFNYARAVQDMYQNEKHWEKKFRGFRFPFTMPGFWGLVALSEKDYSFESSLGANNVEFIHGSVVPHNIVMADDGFYQSTEIIELSPTYHDDYFFLKDLPEDKRQRSRATFHKTLLFEKYLENYWEYAVKPYFGLMVFQGHPGYVGLNDTTLQALQGIIARAKQDNTWIASAKDIADFRKSLINMKFYVKQSGDQYVIQVKAPEGVEAKSVTFALDFKPEEVQATYGKANITTVNKGYYVTVDALNEQKITIVKASL
ncbi:MAG: beta-galactosidase trimerization domain-containing protein [Bacteroidales bacterium]